MGLLDFLFVIPTQGSFSDAGPASSAAAGGSGECIFRCEFVVVLAMRSASQPFPRVTTTHVLQMRHWFQMTWVNAAVVAANMIQLHAIRDGTYRKNVGQAMSQPLPAFKAQAPIASDCLALPNLAVALGLTSR